MSWTQTELVSRVMMMMKDGPLQNLMGWLEWCTTELDGLTESKQGSEADHKGEKGGRGAILFGRSSFLNGE